MTIEIKALQRSDERVLLHVAAEVFDHPVDPELTREFLEDPRHHIAVAIDEGVVVGFASGVHYIHPDKPPELWINEVAVAPTHRRRGLGEAVLRALLEVGRAHHCTVAWVLRSEQCRRDGALCIGRGDRRSGRHGAQRRDAGLLVRPRGRTKGRAINVGPDHHGDFIKPLHDWPTMWRCGLRHRPDPDEVR